MKTSAASTRLVILSVSICRACPPVYACGLEPVFISENAGWARDFFAGQGKFSQEYWYVFPENLTRDGGKRPVQAVFSLVNTGSYNYRPAGAMYAIALAYIQRLRTYIFESLRLKA